MNLLEMLAALAADTTKTAPHPTGGGMMSLQFVNGYLKSTVAGNPGPMYALNADDVARTDWEVE